MTDPSPRARGWIRRLTRECLRYRLVVTVTLVATLAGVAVDLSIPLLTKTAIDSATGAGARVSLTAIALVLVGLGCTRFACQYARRYSAGLLSLRTQNRLRLDLMGTLLRLSGRDQDRLSVGQLVSRSITDLQLIQGLLAMVPLALGAAVQVVLSLVVMLYLSPTLTCVALLVIPAIGLVVLRGRRALFAATWSAQQSAADLAQHVEETVTGVRVVKGFGQEDRAVDDLIGHGRRLFAMRLRAARLNSWFTPTVSAIPQLGMVAVIALGGYLTMHGSITVGTFLAFASYVTTMTGLARLVTNVVVAGQLARAAVDRVYEVIDQPTDPLLEQTSVAPDGPVGLRFDSVGFTFGSPDGTRDGAPVLRDVSLTVAAGECVAVIGGPGSGKSTLALLADRVYSPNTGRISLVGADKDVDIATLSAEQLHGTVAIAFDEPFLYSDSVGANIALGQPDSAGPSIEDAAHRAAADEFIDRLPSGYDSVVGERGLTLSGGQRQRIALARTLFADPRVLILDDATSAVDATTETAIFAELRRDRTRNTGRTMLVLAHRRSTLALADRVAVMDGGRIVDIGTEAELESRSPLFRSLMSSAPDAVDTADAAAIDVVDMEALWPDVDEPDVDGPGGGRRSARVDLAADAAPGGRGGGGGMGGGRGGFGSGGPMTGALGAMQASPELLDAVAKLAPATEDPQVDDDDARADRPEFNLRQLLTPVRWLLLVAVLCMAVDTGISLAFPTIGRIGINSAVSQHAGALWAATAFGVVLVGVDWIITAVMTLTTARSGERVLYALRVRSYAHLQRLGLDYYERELSGRIMTRMTTDVDALSTFLQTGLTSAVVSTLTVIGVAVALVVTDPSLGSLVLILLIPIAIATLVFRRVSSRAYTRSRELISVVNADFQENVTGLRTTQAYRHTDAAATRFATLADRYVRARMVSQQAISIFFPFITLMSDTATAVVIGIGGHQVARGETSAGTLVAFVLYLGMMFSPVQQLSQVFDGYQQALVGLRRIGELLATPTSVLAAPAGGGPATNGTGPGVPTPASFTGHAELDGVSFRYSGAESNALTDVTLDLPPGRSLALVGQTGAGKSTIVKLLARYYDPTAGSVRMDGTDIRRFPLAGYRSRLGVVPQEAHLFSGTVATNIAYGRPDATREQIADAARGVGALSMIAGLPGGMTHPIGERGQGLSAGQRQLIALARAELVDPDLLLLDEATATLDQATERRVLAASDALTRRRTAVIVAHRLATAARADSIAVVADGRVVERGTHRELLDADGAYARLWAAGRDPHLAFDAAMEPDH
ncbi:ABC transporter ATP-binding protein [Jongsikchunia kroppenstedtii]|uniref:ABC transporter ATP-binding protein n=1 Tax=Jongsikchunia kroppenstedtii TaxID=1121721 RepID=UPI0003770A93|nr:ABC transporter ATP-binding protein [Jongsikchunia kroppenstedtii]